MSRPVVSVVAPVFDEQEGLPEFHERLMSSLRALNLPFEVVYVDDGSRDRSPELLRGFHEADPAVHALYFSRNFGHQIAITAGIDHARGDACVVIDSDGQDPPEVIGRLVAKWREGHEAVYAVRAKREGESAFKRATAALFYRLMGQLARVDIPMDTGDFRLLDRKVVDVMRRLRESHRFVRGLTAWAGFRYARVEYVRKPRLAGSTKYPLGKMLLFGVDGITAFSHVPLRWVSFCGLAAFALSLAAAAWALYVKLFNPRAVQGWTSLVVLVLFLGSIQLMSLGVIGEYLARVFDEVKRRPLYVIARADGFSDGELKPYA